MERVAQPFLDLLLHFLQEFGEEVHDLVGGGGGVSRSDVCGGGCSHPLSLALSLALACACTDALFNSRALASTHREY